MNLYQQQPHRNIPLIPPKHRRQLGDNVRHPVQFRGQLGYCPRKIKRLRFPLFGLFSARLNERHVGVKGTELSEDGFGGGEGA
jgi:hypothetical protein